MRNSPSRHWRNGRADRASARAIDGDAHDQNLQFNQPAARERVFFSHAKLADSPWAASMRANPNEFSKRISFSPDGEILPGWKLILDLTADGYWFSIKDMTDPCGFSYISNHNGVIYTAEPLR